MVSVCIIYPFVLYTLSAAKKTIFKQKIRRKFKKMREKSRIKKRQGKGKSAVQKPEKADSFRYRIYIT